jgi:nitrogen PTS system EIIA component
MTLSDLIVEDVIKVPLAASGKTEAIAELLEVLVTAGKVSEQEKALNALLERESKGSTGLERGVAVPHAKTDAVSSLTVAIGISPDGVDFQALDGEPSHILFLMLAPPDQSGPHIQALSEIARLSRSRAFLEVLRNARSASEVVELINE